MTQPCKNKPRTAPDLTARVEIQDNIKLPPLSAEEGRAFIRELLQSFALGGDQARARHVFVEDGLDELVLVAARRGTVLPRHLMVLGDAVLRAADQVFLDTGRAPKIGRAFVKKALADIPPPGGTGGPSD